MLGRRLLLMIAAVATLVACSTPSASENRIEVAVEADPTPERVATAVPVPTTEPVVETPPPGPTPITLSGGQGIVVPTVDPDAEVPAATGADGDAAEEAEEAPSPTATPVATAEPEAGETSETDETSETETPTPAATATAAPTSSPTPGADTTAPAAPAPTSAPTATPSPTATADPALLANDPVTGEPIDLGGDTSDPDVPASTESAVVRIANGSEVYTLNCLRCHGENGTGSFQAASILGVSQRYSTNQLVAELTSGHPSTFGFGDKLSGNEIRDVVAFVLDAFG